MVGSRASSFIADTRSQQQSQWTPPTFSGLPDIAKCIHCAGQGTSGFFFCKSHCHWCEGTGEACKKQLLKLLVNMKLGDVDAAVVLHAVSTEKRDDEDIVLAAVGRFPKAIQFVSERLKESQEVIDTVAASEAALKKDILNRSLNRSLSKSSLLSHVSTGMSPRFLSELPEAAAEWGSLGS